VKLANKLGWLNVDEMLDHMTPAEFEERYADHLIEPWDSNLQTLSAGFAAVINEVRRQMAGENWRETMAIPLDAFIPAATKEREQPETKTDAFLETMRKRAGL
jgi:hypothetical protein